jgi:2-pyrone-4,6-dicarboxylate lactonase
MSGLVNPKVTEEFGVTDCHSHVYGPYGHFPLAEGRKFNPPSSPIKLLEEVWERHGIGRGVLIQGSAYETDHSALLNAIALDPEHRRGVAILTADVSDAELIKLHQSGIRGVRFNWAKHLLSKTAWNRTVVLAEAATLLSRVHALGWHGELHIDAELLDLAEDLNSPRGLPVVIDHMARLDGSQGTEQPYLIRLLRLQEREHIWIKVSGADRLAKHSSSLQSVIPIVRLIFQQSPEKCVWGLDWPHVNLETKRSDVDLVNLLDQVAPGESERRKLLVTNPARLYDFPSTNVRPESTPYQQEGAIIT